MKDKTIEKSTPNSCCPYCKYDFDCKCIRCVCHVIPTMTEKEKCHNPFDLGNPLVPGYKITNASTQTLEEKEKCDEVKKALETGEIERIKGNIPVVASLEESQEAEKAPEWNLEELWLAISHWDSVGDIEWTSDEQIERALLKRAEAVDKIVCSLLEKSRQEAHKEDADHWAQYVIEQKEEQRKRIVGEIRDLELTKEKKDHYNNPFSIDAWDFGESKDLILNLPSLQPPKET